MTTFLLAALLMLLVWAACAWACVKYRLIDKTPNPSESDQAKDVRKAADSIRGAIDQLEPKRGHMRAGTAYGQRLAAQSNATTTGEK